MRHTHKIRTSKESIEPGGGGINVARVLCRFGTDVEAIFLGGGATGRVLEDLLSRSGVAHCMIPIADDTRLSLTVLERSTDHEYRFVPEGPQVTSTEARLAFDTVSAVPCDYLVASGSLPRGVPEAFYAELREAVASRGTKFILDSSGSGLRRALENGGIYLVKPSRGEFESIVGRALDNDGLIAEAKRLVGSGHAQNVAITLGRNGAIFVNDAIAEVHPPIAVDARSAVGAGDSFLAGMVHGFALGATAHQAFRIGLAAGAAAVLSCGSGLVDPIEFKRLVGSVLSSEEIDDLGLGSDGT